jgi:hypothetical protein
MFNPIPILSVILAATIAQVIFWRIATVFSTHARFLHYSCNLTTICTTDSVVNTFVEHLKHLVILCFNILKLFIHKLSILYYCQAQPQFQLKLG